MQNEVRRYLLGQLEEAEQERIELQLLTDSSFGEEFDTVVDELTDQYVRDELTDDERKRAEKYFLSTPVRQQKLEFAKELLSHADAELCEPAEMAAVRPITPATPSWLDQIRAFWRRPSYAHVGLSAAVVLVVAGLIFFLLSFGNSSPQYTAINVPLSSSDRAQSIAPVSAQLAGAGLELDLPLPEQAKDAKDFRLKLFDESRVERDLTIAERTEQKIKVRIPAAWLSRGSYVIQLWMVKPDGNVERVRGSYNFVVE